MSGLLQKGVELTADEKRALLADLLREKAARSKSSPTSFAQQRLWFLSRLESSSAAYNIPRPLRLRGELDVALLQKTFNTILERHDVLRGRFELVEGQPVQLISPKLEIELPVIELQHLPEAEREAEISRRAIADAEQPFDLTQAPLLRLCLLKLSAQEHVLLLTMHHIVSDGWSMGLLVREMATIYQALKSGISPVSATDPHERDASDTVLPALPIQYADFARWQREWLQGEVLDEQLGYWKQHLAGAPAVLDLPVSRSRLAMQTINGAHLNAILTPALTKSLKELSRREGVTLFMTLLAAFKTLLYRYSGQDDLVVGSPIAGRNRAELENLIGFFVNSLPLRTRLAGNPTFRELLGRVKETALGAYAHQDLPFEKIVEGVQPPRSLSYTPIFQVMFALQNQPAATFNLPGIEIQPLKREFDTAKFDLTLFMSEGEDQLSCWLEYNTDLFAPDTVSRLLQHFEILLEGIAADPDRQIAYLPLLSENEKQQLLVEWNDTKMSFSGPQLVHEFFEASAARTPGAPALVWGNQQLSYGELNARANQLGHHLRKLGVGPEKRVAICLNRSADMVIAVLATLKCGGAYTPLDPNYPAERLSFTLADSEAGVLLTEQSMVDLLAETSAPTVFVNDPALSLEAESNLTRIVEPENLAYVIYTSGSTGRPKGVAIEHRSTVAFLNWALQTFSSAELSRVLLSTSLCFDLSVFELFAPLASGGTVILAANALQLPDLKSSKVTLVNTVPSAMTELVRIKGIPDSVKTINLAGEPLTKSLVDEIYNASKAQKVWNLYGPSEDTTYSTFAAAGANISEEPSIGRPVANSSAYILDAQLQPVPVGVTGQLFLSGAGLARGYLNRPELTAEKFVPDPFSSEPGARMYLTGDVARYRVDGSIEFLGRIDHQVKLRGYRIELGEIETALRDHAAVQDAVVVVHDSPSGHKDLVAYLGVGQAASEPELIAELRALVRKTLPEYMVPAHFVLLEKLPLTPNGKIDRRALPAPDRSRSDFTQLRTEPRNAVEEKLVQIWKTILGVDQVGVTDNFFEIGGHSLLAVRLVSEIEKEFDQKLPLVSLFQNSTVESLAEALQSTAPSTSWPTIVEIQKGTQKTPLFCVSMPNVNALGYVALARHLGVEQRVYGLQAQYPEDLQGEHSQFAVDDMATEYLEAVRRVQPHGPYQLVGMCRGAHIAFEMARRLRKENEEVAFVGILDTWVLENTYNKFLYVGYYARRIRSSLKLGFRDQIELLRKKAGGQSEQTAQAETSGAKETTTELANPMHAYFPGPDFQPKTYAGRVGVFRTRTQPLNRIRDKSLGWGKLAEGGVDIHYVPGRHGASVLREPHVQVLAAEIKKYLVN